MTKKDERVEVSGINIKIGDKEIPLTPAQAKELQDVLNDMFGRSVVVPVRDTIVIERPYYIPGRRYQYWGTPMYRTVSGGPVTMTLTANV